MLTCEFVIADTHVGARKNALDCLQMARLKRGQRECTGCAFAVLQELCLAGKQRDLLCPSSVKAIPIPVLQDRVSLSPCPR